MALTQTSRRVQLRVAYAPGFPSQSDFDTPLPLGSLTAVLTTREGGQSHIEPLYLTEDIKDCTTQYLIDRLVLHRYAKLTLDLEVDHDVLEGILGMTLGINGGSIINMLGPTVFALPLTTMVVGFADGSDPGILFSCVAASSLQITGRVDQKLQVRWELCGKADMPDAGFTFPDCSNITVLRLDTNTSFKINGAEQVQQLRNFTFDYNNNVPLRDFPWTIGAVDIKRLERGDMRTVTMAVTIEGRENDSLGDDARAVPRLQKSFALSLGNGTTQITVQSEQALFEPGNPFQSFDGEVSIACLNLLLTPTRIPGDANSPLFATA